MKSAGFRAWAGLAGIGWAVLVSGACATLAPDPERTECKTNDDCERDQVCALDQGSICVRGGQAPRVQLAMVVSYPGAVTQDNAEVELYGCEADRPSSDALELAAREHLLDEYGIIADYIRVSSCDACLSGGPGELNETCDASGLFCVHRRTGQFTLRSVSRVGRGSQRTVLRLADEASMSSERALPIQWRCSKGNDPPLLVFAPSYTPTAPQLVLDPPLPAQTGAILGSDCASAGPQSSIVYLGPDKECHATLRFRVRPLGAVQPGSEDLSVRFVHADKIATPSTVIDREPEELLRCVDDGQCPQPRTACGETGRCGLDFRGLDIVAAEARVKLVEDTGLPGPPERVIVQTYCVPTADPMDDDPVARSFNVEYAPPQEVKPSPLPSLRLPMDIEFKTDLTGTGETRLDATLDKALCVPDWKFAATPLTLLYRAWNEAQNGALDPAAGRAVELLPGFDCCDTSCLTGQGVQTCTSPVTFTFRTSFVISPEAREQWTNKGCLLPKNESRLGSYETAVSCVDGVGGCQVKLPYGTDDDDCLDFDLTIESDKSNKSTSVFRSQQISGAIRMCRAGPVGADPAGQVVLDTSPLSPRALFRGKIVCSPDLGLDCDPSAAVVVAERLVDDVVPQTERLGPFFFAQRSGKIEGLEGHFSLPIEPGMYVVTALPVPGRPGGPARFRVLDLSESSPLMLRRSDGVLVSDPEDPLTALMLEPGINVRVALGADPAQSSTHVEPKLLPLDIGSWFQQPELVGLDLNRNETCWPKDRACRIRSLRVSADPQPVDEYSLPVNLARNFYFTARHSAYVCCPGIASCGSQ